MYSYRECCIFTHEVTGIKLRTFRLLVKIAVVRGASIFTMKNINLKFILLLVFICAFLIPSTQSVYASLPSSANYKLQSFTFGAGGTSSASSSNFNLNGVVGEVEYGSPTSSSYKDESGLTYMQKANVPAAPTLSTPANNYDRILFVLNPGSDPSDYTYALEISTDSSFLSNVNYINSDGTFGSSLGPSNFQTYSAWGGSSGTFVTGLLSNTPYYIRVAAQQGSYTQSEWGPATSITTNYSTLTFTINNPTITFNNLNSGNSYTDSSQSDKFTTTTNAYNGYTIYGWDNQPLTSPNGSIANYVSPNSSPTAWSGTGFGYTTNDTNLAGSGGTNRFNNGTYYAGFQTAGPGDPIADDVGPVTNTEITNEQYTVSYRVTASNTTPAGTYSNTIMYTIVPSY